MTYRARRRSWEVDAIFSGLSFSSSQSKGAARAGHDREALATRIWTDLVAEYDARHLQAELTRRERVARANGVRAPFTPGCQDFLEAWALDEEKHAEALILIYHLTLGEPVSAIRERLADRRADFAPMAEWLEDEFGLMVMIAYDEAMSTRAYGEDLPFYRELGQETCGSPAFGHALRELKNDEAMHYSNAVDLLAALHAHRAADVKETLERVVEFDRNQSEYRATFLLDHATVQFSETDMTDVGRSVARVLTRRMTKA